VSLASEAFSNIVFNLHGLSSIFWPFDALGPHQKGHGFMITHTRTAPGHWMPWDAMGCHWGFGP
jgi:hypothetical protein